MAIEPVPELGSGSALRVPRARVVPLTAPPATYTAAVERYLTGAGIPSSPSPRSTTRHCPRCSPS
ncbi:hypothetical protein [Streptomyces sp. NBC_01508]|uniref:hypothetical protein n=1 Tax=Streptomyces sp. NBC_01508 TaxID=2903888 RepID=UPI003870C315